MAQVWQTRRLVNVGRRRRHRVDDLGAAVDADVRRHAEEPLVALLRLMHVGVTGAVRVKYAWIDAQRGAYGSPRMVRGLQARGFPARQGAGGAADAGERHPRPPQAAPLQSRLPVAGAVLGTLAHDGGRAEARRVNPTGWKTKN